MSDKREWLKSETDELINLYHIKPELWDVKSQVYKDKAKKRDAITEIATKFNTTAEEINRKIHNLRNQFNSEFKKSLKKKSGVQSTDELYVSRWPYFKSLSFLQGGSICRQPVGNNIPADETTEDEQNLQTDQDSISQQFLIETSQESPMNPNKRKKIETQQNDFLIQNSLSDLNEHEDQYDIFGKFIASEMRNLSSDYLRRKMKRNIHKVMLEINDEELTSYNNSSSRSFTSSTMQSTTSTKLNDIFKM